MKAKFSLEEFQTIDRVTWLNKIKADLKNQNLNSFDYSPNKDLAINPFESDFRNSNLLPIHTGNRKNEECRLGEVIQLSHTQKSNNQILMALEGGAQNLRFNLGNSELDWNEILKGVFLNMVEFDLFLNAPNDIDQQLSHPLFVEQADKLKYNIHLNGPTDHYIALNRILKHQNNVLPFLGIADLNALTDSFRDIMLNALEWFKFTSAQGLDVPKKMSVLIKINNHYLFSISAIRSLRILWANLIAALQIKSGPKLVIYSESDVASYDEDIYKNMIAISMQALAAITGGTDVLYLYPANWQKGEYDPFTARIARNVYHILKMESFVDIVQDPAAGSVFIESLTTQIAEKSWAKFLSTATV